MKRLFTLILLFSSTLVQAQQVYSVKNKKAIALYEQTENMIIRREYDRAIPMLNEALNKEPDFIEAHIRIGQAYEVVNQIDQAKYHLKTAIALSGGNQTYIRAHKDLGLLYFRASQYDKAVAELEIYQKTSPNDPMVKKFLGDARWAAVAMKDSIDFNPSPVSAPINQYTQQYFPVLTVDGKVLFFTKREGSRGNEDIVVSFLGGNGQWSRPESVSQNINTPDNEGTCTISADGRIMIFTSCEERKGLGSCDLYVSYREGEKWTKAENLGSPVNSKAWESQPSLSADGRMLYFVSNRSGGYGQRDIYVTQRNEAGAWSKPKNLGSIINTAGEDVSPFIHANGKSLFFSSTGRKGFGGFDLYKSEFGNEWSEPKNLGYPLNDANDQLSLFITADGTKAYYSNEIMQHTAYYSFLYAFDVPKELKPPKLTGYVTGFVKDRADEAPLSAELILYDIDTDEQLGVYAADKADGTFMISIPEDGKYALYVHYPGYLFKTVAFAIEKNETPHAYEEIHLSAVRVGATTVLNNIFFDTDQYDLRPESKPELLKVVNFIKENPDIKVEIAGYTDHVGDPKHNLELSRKRAQSVYNFLIQNGVPQNGLTFKGYGEADPIASNDDEAGRQKNRRIEFIVK